MASALYVVLLFCCVIHCSSGGTPNATTRKLYLLTLLPYPNPNPLFSPSWEEGPNIVPALDLAARHVNQREGILDGYELELIHKDGGCDLLTTTLPNLVRGLFTTNNSVVGLIGPGCSSSALAVLSTISTQNRTSLIAVHGAGSSFIKREAFPNSFGIFSLNFQHINAMFELIKLSGWRNIALITDSTEGSLLNRVLKQQFLRTFPDGSILFSAVFYDFHIPLEALQGSRARVVITAVNRDLSRRIMCLALRSGMLYPDYQWVFIGHAFEDFTAGTIAFNYNGEVYNCSTEEIATKALDGSFVVNFKITPFKEDEPTFSGLSHREYLEQYSTSVVEHNSNSENDPVTVSIWATYFYDAVWTWAIVLDNVTKSNTFQIEDYQLDQPNTALIAQFEQIDFQGVSGRINFDSNTGSVERSTDFFQVFNGTAEYVAYYNAGVIVTLSDHFEFIPDSFPIEARRIHPSVAVVMLLPLLVQTVIIIATQIAVIVHRNAKPIKAASSNITHIAYIGVYFFVAGYVLSTVDHTLGLTDSVAVLCQTVWAFLYPFGFTLAFGTAIVKTWRLYRLFIHVFNPGRKFISKRALNFIVCLLLSVNIVIAIVWTATDPFFTILIFTTDTSDNARSTLRRVCDCNYYFAWFAMQWGYLFLLLAILLTFVCLTRNIKRKSFKTVTLQVLVYGTIGVFAVFAPLYYFGVFLRLSFDITYSMLGIMVNAIVALYLSCVFLPPVVRLMRQKKLIKFKRKGTPLINKTETQSEPKLL